MRPKSSGSASASRKAPARWVLKARILLKADVSEGGPGWSDSKIIAALDTSVSMLYRVRKQLVEEGFEAVLSRKQRATPAVARIFDGEKEAKLIALACSKTDRGPYVKGRCIDLSKAGARALGFAGLAPVNVVPVVSDQPSVNRCPGAAAGQLVKDAAR